jgi:hypothetical protein
MKNNNSQSIVDTKNVLMNNFKKGEVVFERIRPNIKMVIITYANNLYYCKLAEFPHRKELVFFERELTSLRFESNS